MSDPRIDPRVDYAPATQLRSIDLHGTNQEANDAPAKTVGPQVPAQEFQHGACSNDGVRKKESFEPGRCSPAIQSLESRRIKRVPVKSERADHNNDFDHHQP